MIPDISVEQDVRLTVSDGVELSSDVYSPAAPGGYPTLLMRLPYGSAVASSPVYRHPTWYASQGFCVVIQDVRGTSRSGGSFYPRCEQPDTLAAIEWAASLPRSNGRVGMYGFSYQGLVQMQAAAGGAAALAAIAPAQTAADFYTGWHYEGGIPLYTGAINWGLQLAGIAAVHDHREADAARFARFRTDTGALMSSPPLIPEAVADVPWIRDWLQHETRDEYWARQAIPPVANVPGLWIAGWYDSFLQGTIDARAATLGEGGAEQSLIVGPWQHQPWSRNVGVKDYGPAAVSPVDDEQVAFFRRYLQDEGPDRSTACKVFATGLDEWRLTATWPPATRKQRLFLDSDGDANGERETGLITGDAPTRATFDVFTSEPLVPVPAIGGRGQGPADQRGIERLRAVATYSSSPLEDDILITGAVAHLSVACSGTDCDWVIRLCDVDPQGRSLNISQGAIRSRFRGGLDRCDPIVPFASTAVEIPTWDCAHVFRAGHQIRLHVAGSSFPYYARNPGSCVPAADLPVQGYSAVSQFVQHGPGQQSYIDLRIADLQATEPWMPPK
jgi:putative CocE/NonD family hydrolase